jgi:hypothetical protein
LRVHPNHRQHSTFRKEHTGHCQCRDRQP